MGGGHVGAPRLHELQQALTKAAAVGGAKDLYLLIEQIARETARQEIASFAGYLLQESRDESVRELAGTLLRQYGPDDAVLPGG